MNSRLEVEKNELKKHLIDDLVPLVLGYSQITPSEDNHYQKAFGLVTKIEDFQVKYQDIPVTNLQRETADYELRRQIELETIEVLIKHGETALLTTLLSFGPTKKSFRCEEMGELLSASVDYGDEMFILIASHLVCKMGNNHALSSDILAPPSKVVEKIIIQDQKGSFLFLLGKVVSQQTLCDLVCEKQKWGWLQYFDKAFPRSEDHLHQVISGGNYPDLILKCLDRACGCDPEYLMMCCSCQWYLIESLITRNKSLFENIWSRGDPQKNLFETLLENSFFNPDQHSCPRLFQGLEGAIDFGWYTPEQVLRMGIEYDVPPIVTHFVEKEVPITPYVREGLQHMKEFNSGGVIGGRWIPRRRGIRIPDHYLVLFGE